MKTLYLVRHGQYYQVEKDDAASNAPATKQALDERTRQADGGLTPVGVQQAERTAQRFSSLSIHAIHTSSLPRAVETATIIAASLPNLPLKQSRDLWECIPHVPPKLAEWAKSMSAKSLESNKAHADAAFDHYFQADPTDDADKVNEIIVCHGNIIRYFICKALAVTPDAWVNMETSNCSISCVRIEPDETRKLASLNETGHLSDELITYQSVKTTQANR